MEEGKANARESDRKSGEGEGDGQPLGAEAVRMDVEAAAAGTGATGAGAGARGAAGAGPQLPSVEQLAQEAVEKLRGAGPLPRSLRGGRTLQTAGKTPVLSFFLSSLTPRNVSGSCITAHLHWQVREHIHTLTVYNCHTTPPPPGCSLPPRAHAGHTSLLGKLESDKFKRWKPISK